MSGSYDLISREDFPDQRIQDIISQAVRQCDLHADYVSGLKKALEALELLSDSLERHDAPESAYGGCLDQILNVMRLVYRSARPSISVHDLGDGIIGPLRRKLSGNGKLARLIMGKFLCHGASHQYDVSGLGTRLSNDLLNLTITLNKRMSAETANRILSFIPVVLNDLRLQPYPASYLVSARWRNILHNAVKVATNLVDPHHLLAMGWGGGCFCYDAVLADRDTILECYQNTLNMYPAQRSFLESSEETAFSVPGTTVEHNGKSLSLNHITYAIWCMALFKAIGNDASLNTVVEVGTGFGAFARLLRNSRQIGCYILVDIPESLIFAHTFLVANFPDARVHVIRSTADVYEGMTRDFDLIFCPIQQINALNGLDVDLAVNNWSLGEMRQECADYIVSAIETHIKPRYFYSVNMIFQDKGLDIASGYREDASDNNNLVALNVSAMWRPMSFSMMPVVLDDAQHGKNYTSSVATVLERVAPDRSGELIPAFTAAAAAVEPGSDEWLKHMYLVALWTESVDQIEAFLRGLRLYYDRSGIAALPVFDFEKVGEVIHLRKRIAQLAARA